MGHPVLCMGRRLGQKRKTITEPTEPSHDTPIYRVDTLYFCTAKLPSLHRDCYDRAPTTIALSQQLRTMEVVNAPPASATDDSHYGSYGG